MPVTKSAAKSLRRDNRRKLVNKKTRLKIKKAIDSIKKENITKKSLEKLYSTLDRASKNKVIHPNKAARLKSRLTSFVSQKQSKPKPSPKKQPLKTKKNTTK